MNKSCLTLKKCGLVVGTIPQTGSDFQGAERSPGRAVTERAGTVPRAVSMVSERKADSEGLWYMGYLDVRVSGLDSTLKAVRHRLSAITEVV